MRKLTEEVALLKYQFAYMRISANQAGLWCCDAFDSWHPATTLPHPKTMTSTEQSGGFSYI
jgi:hypothetical protein